MSQSAYTGQVRATRDIQEGTAVADKASHFFCANKSCTSHLVGTIAIALRAGWVCKGIINTTWICPTCVKISEY